MGRLHPRARQALKALRALRRDARRARARRGCAEGGNSRARGTGSTCLFRTADAVRAGKASHHCGHDLIVQRCSPFACLPDTHRRSAGGADLCAAVFPLRHHLLYGEASHGPVVRLGSLYLHRFLSPLCDRPFVDDHLYDASLDGADELRAPRYLVGAAPRHVCDARLHSALLSDAQAARDEKRGHMADRRLAHRTRRAAASDELRHHAAVERCAAQLQQFFTVFLSQRPMRLCAARARQHSARAHARRLALAAGREERK